MRRLGRGYPVRVGSEMLLHFGCRRNLAITPALVNH
jgi:hypothetical protein